MLSTSAQKTQTVARTGSLGSGPGTVGAFTLALRTLLENRSGSADAADQYPIVRASKPESSDYSEPSQPHL